MKYKRLGLLTLCFILSTPTHAGPFTAVGTWLTSSATCWALIAPPAQLACAIGAGILTGSAAVIPVTP